MENLEELSQDYRKGIPEDNSEIRQNTYGHMVHKSEYIMTSYYDLILGLIPLTLFGIAGTLTLLGLQLTLAVPVAATVSVALIGHALFVNEPADAPGTTTAPPRASD